MSNDIRASATRDDSGDWSEELVDLQRAIQVAFCPYIPDAGTARLIGLAERHLRQHLAPGTGYFEPTPQWDHEHSWDRLWS